MDTNRLSNQCEGVSRRTFLAVMGATGANLAVLSLAAETAASEVITEVITIRDSQQGEDVFAYIHRVKGGFDKTLYQQVIGAANAFKEGDQTIGVGAKDEATRQNARSLLANTKIKDLYEHPLLTDDLQKLIWKTTDQAQYEKVKDWTMGQLKEFLLTKSEADIKGVMYGLTSDTIGCVPKLMNNEELSRDRSKDIQPVAGHQDGGKGLHGRPHSAEFTHGPSGGRDLAGL